MRTKDEEIYALNRVADLQAQRNCELVIENARLRESLEKQGFTDCGGELWKPPIQNVNVVRGLLAEIDRLREGLERIINVSRFTGNWDTAVAIASEALERK